MSWAATNSWIISLISIERVNLIVHSVHMTCDALLPSSSISCSSSGFLFLGQRLLHVVRIVKLYKCVMVSLNIKLWHLIDLLFPSVMMAAFGPDVGSWLSASGVVGFFILLLLLSIFLSALCSGCSRSAGSLYHMSICQRNAQTNQNKNPNSDSRY